MERLCALYGYRPIQTPVFEDTELFQRTSGEGSDVVQKEMYTFTDRSDRSLTLRPEGTAPICRAYLSHGLQQEPQPQKLYTIAPMYRYGRPGPRALPRALAALGGGDRLRRSRARRRGAAALRHAAAQPRRHRLPARAELDRRPQLPARVRRAARRLARRARARSSTPTPARSSRTSPLRALDNLAAKPLHVQELLRDAPTIGDSLCDACVEHFAQVRALLDALGVAYTLVPTLVRGLDYYTRTTWEFVGPLEGANSTISGGGRYDGLIEEIGGPPTPGVGFGAGIERLLLALEDAEVTAEPPTLDVFVVGERTLPGAARRAGWPSCGREGSSLTSWTTPAARSKGQLTQAKPVWSGDDRDRGGGSTRCCCAPSTPDDRVEYAELVARLATDDLADPHVRRADRGARRRAADPLRLDGAPARPRRARLRRPARPERRHPARDQPRARARGRGARTRNPERVRAPRRGRARRARAGDRQRRTCPPARSSSRSTRSRSSAARRRSRSSSTRRTSTRRCACATAGSTSAATSSSGTSDCAPRWSGSSAARWRRRASSTSRRRSSSSRRPRAPATSSFRAGSSRAASTRCPQSPQILKQLTMVAGFDRYYQIAICFRDEDLRADRVQEITQLDVEMSFPDQELLFALMEEMFSRIWRECLGIEIQTPFPRHDLRGGRPSLRLRQAGHALRARARGRDRGDARLRVRRLRGRRGGSLPPRAEGVQPRRAREARGAREGVGGEGARLPRLRRRRGPLADRQVPLGGGARRVRRQGRRDAPLRGRRPADDLARARRAPPPPRPRARPDRRERVHVPLGRGLPDVRARRRGVDAGPPSTTRSRGRPTSGRSASRTSPSRRSRTPTT